MMRNRSAGFWAPAILLALAGCDRASDPAPVQPIEAPPLPSSETSGAGALLDRLVAPRQQGEYAPRDECASLPGARAFREALAAAVQKRDIDAIAALASEDVRLGFGGDDGLARLRAKLGESNGELIDELAGLLALGCAATDGGGLTIPWYFAEEYGDVDSYSAMLVTGREVPLYAGADTRSAVKARLSWNMVTLDEGLRPGDTFQAVTGAGGMKGFMPTDKLRSVLDYRLLAVRQDDGWKITALVAGD
jgi:hypothetical protein